MEPGRPTIVVGVDGTPSSRVVLRRAAEVARTRDARLHAVLAWDSPIAHTDPRSVRLARNAAALLAEVLHDAGDDVRELDVGPIAVRGEASQVLLAAAAQASLLVLGRAGGLTGRAGAGGVRRRCVEQTACPVVVVPAPATADLSGTTPHTPATHSDRETR